MATPVPGLDAAACTEKAVSTAQKLHEFTKRVKCSLFGRISGVLPPQFEEFTPFAEARRFLHLLRCNSKEQSLSPAAST
jgi:hypothetical protein